MYIEILVINTEWVKYIEVENVVDIVLYIVHIYFKSI